MSSYSTGVRRPRSLTMTLLLLGGGCERMCFLGRVQGLARTAPAVDVIRRGKNGKSRSVKSYVGGNKGLLQVLYERGLYVPGMKLREDGATQRKKIFAGKPLLDPALNANLVLSRCPDFASEVSALQELLESRGHILIVCVKCHPELAGCGIEYSWGKSKMEFRRKNTGVNKRSNLLERVERSLETAMILPIERIWKFERRTRNYRSVYVQIASDDVASDDVDHKFIEKMAKNHKTHRNIVEIDREFLQQL